MLNRNTKLIWREGGREGKRKGHEVGGAERQPEPSTYLSQSPQHLPGVPRRLLRSHWDRQAPPLAQLPVTGGLQSLLLYSQT